MDAQLQLFKEFAHPLGEQIIAWARPEGWGPSPLSEWPLTSFEFALGTAICYLSFVFIGMVSIKHHS